MQPNSSTSIFLRLDFLTVTFSIVGRIYLDTERCSTKEVAHTPAHIHSRLQKQTPLSPFPFFSKPFPLRSKHRRQPRRCDSSPASPPTIFSMFSPRNFLPRVFPHQCDLPLLPSPPPGKPLLRLRLLLRLLRQLPLTTTIIAAPLKLAAVKTFQTDVKRLDVVQSLSNNPDLVISSSSNDEVNTMMMCDAVLTNVQPGKPLNRSQVITM